MWLARLMVIDIGVAERIRAGEEERAGKAGDHQADHDQRIGRLRREETIHDRRAGTDHASTDQSRFEAGRGKDTARHELGRDGADGPAKVIMPD